LEPLIDLISVGVLRVEYEQLFGLSKIELIGTNSFVDFIAVVLKVDQKDLNEPILCDEFLQRCAQGEWSLFNFALFTLLRRGIVSCVGKLLPLVLDQVLEQSECGD
jgi:hypothetical protein